MKKIPQRLCVSCKERKNKSELIRVVLLPDGQVEVDPSGKMPGRGAYVCRNNACLETAGKAHRIERSLKGSPREEISAELKAALEFAEKNATNNKSNRKAVSGQTADAAHTQKTVTEERVLSFLGIALKAGQLVSGADAVSAASVKNKVHLFIAAEDSAEGTLRLLNRLSEDRKIPLYRFSSKGKLGKQLGQRDRAIVAVTDKNFAEQLVFLLNEYTLK